MSAGGDGIIDTIPLVELAQVRDTRVPFVPRRFRLGGRLELPNSSLIERTPFLTCVLCGGLIINEQPNQEHPLPQWLHNFAGEVGDRKANAFNVLKNANPTWRQLCLASHGSCNSKFGRKVEEPVITPFKSVVAGGRVTWMELDAIFDWLDKIKASAAHMALALRGHDLLMSYDEISFPNRRVGLYDRLAIIFRIDDPTIQLDLWHCLHEGFLSTPSSLVLRVRDLVIVYTRFRTHCHDHGASDSSSFGGLARWQSCSG